MVMAARSSIAPVGTRHFADLEPYPYSPVDETDKWGETEMTEMESRNTLLIVVAREDAVDELGEIVIGFGEDLVVLDESGVSGAVCPANRTGAPSFGLEAGGMSVSLSGGRLVAGSIGSRRPLVIDNDPEARPSSLLLFTDRWSAVTRGDGGLVTIWPGSESPREEAPLSVLCGRHLCQVDREGVFVRNLATDEGMLVERDEALVG